MGGSWVDHRVLCTRDFLAGELELQWVLAGVLHTSTALEGLLELDQMLGYLGNGWSWCGLLGIPKLTWEL